MMVEQRKKQVVERFNREGAPVWSRVHSGEIEDIIQLEVQKRKEFARNFIRRQFHDQSAAIAEIGCGSGRNLEEIISENPSWSGVGVDNAAAMVEHCRKQYEANGQLSFDMLDIDTEALDRKFDVVILLGVVGYFSSNRNAFQNIQRMLRPGGYVIFTYGRGFSVARTLRAAFRCCKDTLRSAYCRFVQRKPAAGPQPSFFRCYTFSDVKNAFPPQWRIVSHQNLVFGSGIFKRGSVRISRFLEKFFARCDLFRLALTSIVVAVNDSKDAAGK